MQFKSFHWLRRRGIRATRPCSINMVRIRAILGGGFILFFFILGVFLIKQLFHSRLLDMT